MSKKYNNYIIMANDFLYRSLYKKAQEAFYKALSFAITTKEKTDAYFEIADIYLIENEYEKALLIFKEIIELDPSLSGGYYGVALYYDINNDLEKAKYYYEMAIKKDETYDRAYYYLAHVLDRMGNSKAAMDYLLKCVELDPYDYVSYSDIGALFEENNENEKALEYIDKSLLICKNYPRALYNRGVVLGRLKKYDEALEEYKKALDESNAEDIYLNMSAIYLMKEEYKNAVAILLEGTFENPNSENLYYNLGCAYEHLGKRKEAVDAIKKSIELNHDILEFARGDEEIKNLIESEEIIG